MKKKNVTDSLENSILIPLTEKEAMKIGITMVNKLVNAQRQKMPSIPEPDLRSYLNLKLIGLWEKFNPEEGTWSRYISPNLKFYTLNWIRDNYKDMKVSRKYLEIYNKAKKIKKDFPEIQCLSLTQQQGVIASKLGITIEVLIEAEQAVSCRFTDDITIAEIDLIQKDEEEELDSLYAIAYENLTPIQWALMEDYHIKGGENLSEEDKIKAENLTNHLRELRKLS